MVSQISQPRQKGAPDRSAVMIVEDDQTSRRALGLLLSTCGYRPQAFRSAEEALATVGKTALPPVALIDLDLPGISGLDLIARLEALAPSVYPILITATDEDSLAMRLEGRHVTYIRKPVDFEMLLTMLSDSQVRH
jgi:CheY-like chemotaxis protein